MADPVPDPNNPQPTPGNPNPEPARPPPPPETPRPGEPPGVPSPSPDPVPSPEKEPVQIPPGTPPEIPSQPGFPAPTASASVKSCHTTTTMMLLVGLLSLGGLSSPVFAQSPENDGESKALERCRADPEDKAEEKKEGQSNDDQRSAALLERCEGVLLPPPTGDREIEEPPADTGTTPVIPPGRVPEQPPG